MFKASHLASIVNEFETVDFGDKRLQRRLKEIASDLSQSPQSSIPQAAGSWARTKGAYRFFDHPQVSWEGILSGHKEATLERMRGEKVVLMIQDTTGLQYASQQAGSGLGSIGNRGDKALGLWLHTTLVVNEQRTALGIVNVQTWVRDPKRAGIAARRKKRVIEDKESYRWLKSFQESVSLAKELPQTRVINLADREGDIYELFAQAAQSPEVGVLVRARHNRALEGEEKKLLDFVSAQPVAGLSEIVVPRQPGVPSYRAVLEIRFAEVTLKSKKSGAGPLKLWMVEARQHGVSAPKALCWRLITNQPVRDLAAAVEKVNWYRSRWSIEEFHRVLKSGCKAESRQLERVERLRKVLMLDMIIAWRVMELTRAARQQPDSSATPLLTDQEVRVLCVMHEKLAGRSTLTLREAVRAIAQWGGFLARKSDGEPGPMSLWLGLQKLHQYTAAFSRFQTCG